MVSSYPALHPGKSYLQVDQELEGLPQLLDCASRAIESQYSSISVRLLHGKSVADGRIPKIFERSQLAQETGAAIHLAPNCHGILRRLGIFPESFGANLLNGVSQLWHFSCSLLRVAA